jgi:hypothetical protein
MAPMIVRRYHHRDDWSVGLFISDVPYTVKTSIRAWRMPSTYADDGLYQARNQNHNAIVHAVTPEQDREWFPENERRMLHLYRIVRRSYMVSRFVIGSEQVLFSPDSAIEVKEW